MILHLLHDEKIVNRTINLFEEAYPDNNLFVVFSGKKKFRFVEKKLNVISYKEFFRSRNDYAFSAVIIHFLNIRKINFLLRLNKWDLPIYWIIWGADLYNKLLVPKGFKMFPPNHFFTRDIKWWRTPVLAIKKYIASKKQMKTIDFIKTHVDYIVTDTTENDYDNLVLYYPQLKVKKWKDFFYYPIDMILSPELLNLSVKKNWIMIGNSASATNNHEYALELLSKLDIGDRKVVMPLSYSGKKKYIKHILNIAENSLGENFYPLLKFMPLSEYNEILLNVNVAIFANWRQEAIGNILVALYLGAKVYISSHNPIFDWAANHGFIIFELEKINQFEIDNPLDDIAINTNRKIIQELYNRDRFMELVRSLLKND